MSNYANLLYVYILLKNPKATWAPECTLDGIVSSSGLAAAWGFCEKDVLPLSSLTESGACGSQEANLWEEEGPYIQASVFGQWLCWTKEWETAWERLRTDQKVRDKSTGLEV